MNLRPLMDKHKGETIYIVGTGPSMQFFPVPFLKDKITIGLNDAWQYLTLDYCLTIHPETMPKDYLKYSQTKWVTKRKDWLQSPTYDQVEKTYWFKNTNKEKVTDLSNVTNQDDMSLYVGHGIQTGALCLAAWMGARTAILVGCDMNALGGDHHAHDTHTQFYGLSEADVYDEYYQNTARVRSLLREHNNMNVLSLNPFLGLGNHEVDSRRLKAELDLPSLPPPKEKHRYNRGKTEFTS